MTPEEFRDHVKSWTNRIRLTLEEKAGRYAREDDRLHNFKVAARMAKRPPAQVLWGMALKHLVVIQDWLDYGPPPEFGARKEVLGDMVNYLILLDALWEECFTDNPNTWEKSVETKDGYTVTTYTNVQEKKDEG